jgi:hypothetical protein
VIELSFVTECSVGSGVIRWFTHSNYSHVDIIMPTGVRLGARSDHPVNGRTGVQLRSKNYAEFTIDDRLFINAPHEAEGYAWLEEQIGKPYDVRGLYASFLFARPTPWREERAWWCSELALRFLEECGIPEVLTPCNRITPNDCYIYAGAFAL